HAMAMIGLERGAEDPFNGHVVTDGSGAPTGMLYEEAVGYAVKRLPRLTRAQDILGVRQGQALANRHGITGIVDPSVTGREAAAYATLAEEGALTLRVGGAARVAAGDSTAATCDRLEALRRSHSGPDFRIHSAKFFLDGIFENRTAALLEPYADEKGGNAAPLFSDEQVRALFCALDAARFQIHCHVIGDLAARQALDGFAAAAAVNGRWPSLHQLAHLQLIRPADMVRMAALGVMGNIQPLWARHDPAAADPAHAMIGPARLGQTYAFRQMANAGVQLCLSSDWSVSTLNPFAIIETALTRQAPLAEGALEPFLPAEALTIREAVLGYTLNAAAAAWRSDETGRLSPGFSADMIILDRDIFRCAPHEIGGTEVLWTLFKGREVYRAAGFDG
ncbi:MAG: amidohydrolase family protein, partial [Paracoccaceae bacterium]